MADKGKGTKLTNEILEALQDPAQRAEIAQRLAELADTAGAAKAGGRHNGTVFTSRQYKRGKVVVDEKTESEVFVPDEVQEPLAVRVFETAPATVGISMGLTMNLEKYESARFDVTITLPCYAGEEVEAFDYAKRFAEERLARLQSETEEYRKSRGY